MARRRLLDIGFWSSWSPASAWSWGLVCGDGWLSRFAVYLCGSEEVVGKAKSLSHAEYKNYVRKGCVSSILGGVQLVRIAKSMVDLSPGYKADRITWPTDLPKEMVRHFVRGLWDSDGSWSVWHNTKGSRGAYLVGVFTSKSHALVHRLRDELRSSAGLDKGTISFLKPTGCAQLRYFGADVEKLGHWLYQGVDREMFDEVKRARFDRFFATKEAA